jgi:uncharacterized protein involved in exopolysaccharide biosynthesis
MYPTKTYSISKSLLGEKYSPDILQFGEEVQAEQLIQIINSDAVKNRVITKYDLLNHYEIDASSPKMRSELLRTYDSNINVERTMLMSVKVEVMDKSPEVAAGIANDIASLVDSAWNGITRERAGTALQIIEGEYFQQLNYIRAIEDSMRKIAVLGVYDYDEQSRMIDRQYYKTVNNYHEAKGALTELTKVYGNDNKAVVEASAKKRGAEEAMKALEKEKKLIATYGSQYLTLQQLLTAHANQFNLIKRRYDEAKIDLENNLPFKFVVNSAEVPDRKSYPVRWLIVVIAAISAFVLCLGIILLIDNFQEVRLKASES